MESFNKFREIFSLSNTISKIVLYSFAALSACKDSCAEAERAVLFASSFTPKKARKLSDVLATKFSLKVSKTELNASVVLLISTFPILKTDVVK